MAAIRQSIGCDIVARASDWILIQVKRAAGDAITVRPMAEA
jgi:hypothetical protein